MKLDLYINEANDYARDIRVPILHPHVAIIHYDEVGEIRHSLNRIDCYGIFLQREFPENLTYGIGIYHEGDGSLIAFRCIDTHTACISNQGLSLLQMRVWSQIAP